MELWALWELFLKTLICFGITVMVGMTMVVIAGVYQVIFGEKKKKDTKEED